MLRRGLPFSSFNSDNANTHLNKSGLTVLSGWPGRQYAGNANAAAAEAEAEVQAEALKNPNGGNRVKGRRLPRAERHAMLESFVNKFRAMNAGAFPTVSYAKQQMGGSYYTVKSILQELQYKAKTTPLDPATEDLLVHEEVRERESLAQVEENSTAAQNVSKVTYDSYLPGHEEVGEIESPTQFEENAACGGVGEAADSCVQNDLEAIYDPHLSSGRILEEAKEEFRTSSTAEILSEEVITPGSDSHLVDNSENSETKEAQADKHDFVSKEKRLPMGQTNRAYPPTVGNTEIKKQEHTLEELPDLDDSKCKTEQDEEIPPPDKLSKDLSGSQADDAEASRKSTLWGNMKSFASGIIGIFRKL